MGNVSGICAQHGDGKKLFDKVDVAKQNWKIEIKEDDTLLTEPEAEVTAQWPQLKMVANQLRQLPAGSNARNIFKGQAKVAMNALQKVKDNFTGRYEGTVGDAYASVARPSDEKPEDQKYFDTLNAKRAYVVLYLHVQSASGEDAVLPLVRYKK